MVTSDISYSAKLRELSKDYYQNHIRLDEYRSQRKLIIDKIDEEFNGRKIQANPLETSDINTQQSADDSSVFMKTIAFFKNNDVED